MLNAMTVDLEDWGTGVLDPRCAITSRIVGNLDRVLALLDRHHVRATFFALGKACEAFPELLPRIRDAGHEIGSHGYGHELVYRLQPEQFAADIRRSINIIESQISARPAGYRAPAFSITRESLWAGRLLAEAGFRYDSSIFPIAGRRYGIADAPRSPYQWPDCQLLEFPMTAVRVLGTNWPICGGGYTRLVPAPIMSAAIRAANRAGRPAVVYLHPYELAPREVQSFQADGLRIKRRLRFTQELWRSRVAPRISHLLKAARFGPMAEALHCFLADTRRAATAETLGVQAPARPCGA